MHSNNLIAHEILQAIFEYELLNIYNNSIFKNYQNNSFWPLRFSGKMLEGVTDSFLSKNNLVANDGVFL